MIFKTASNLVEDITGSGLQVGLVHLCYVASCEARSSLSFSLRRNEPLLPLQGVRLVTEPSLLSWAPQGQRLMCGMHVPGPLPCPQKALLTQGAQSTICTLITRSINELHFADSTIKEEAQVPPWDTACNWLPGQSRLLVSRGPEKRRSSLAHGVCSQPSLLRAST